MFKKKNLRRILFRTYGGIVLKILIESEIFKLKKEKKYLILGSIVILAVLCSQIMSAYSEAEVVNGCFQLLIDNGIVLLLYIGNLFFICFHLGRQFNTKRIHLEVMNGFTRGKIFFSKLFMLLVISLLFSWLIIGIFIFTVRGNIFTGQSFIVSENLMIKAGLLTFLLIRFYAFMIFINFLIRQGVLSGIVIWLYNVVQMLPTMLGESDFISVKTLKIFSGLFGWGQCLELTSMPVCGEMICKIIVTGVVELLLVGFGCYMKFSKQELK